MKQYPNGNKATEFSRKQVGVIYRLAKAGELEVEKWVMSDFYELAEYYGYDDNRSIEHAERQILEILDNVFNKKLIVAQGLIYEYTQEHWNLMGKKSQKKASRELVK